MFTNVPSEPRILLPRGLTKVGGGEGSREERKSCGLKSLREQNGRPRQYRFISERKN